MSSINFNVPSSQTAFIAAAPISEDSHPPEIEQRKSQALARLGEIEAMTANQDNPFAVLSTHFICHPNLAAFDLDALLSKYQTDEDPSALFAYCDRAGVQDDSKDWENFESERKAVEASGDRVFPMNSVWKRFDKIFTRFGSDQQRRQRFEQLRQYCFQSAIKEYSDENQQLSQYRIIKKYLKHILAYFNEQQAIIINPNTPPEIALATKAALKTHVCNLYRMIIDADANCIDQMLSQFETFIVNMLIESQGSLSLQQQLFNQTGLVLSKYRNALLKLILAEQNPNEEHMADLERFTMKKLASRLNIPAEIFSAGAQFERVIHNREAKAERAITAFLEVYKPVEYLLEGLGQSMEGDGRSASHIALMKWTIEHYDLNQETPGETVMESRISSQPEELPITMGGGTTPSATALLMETAGLIAPRPSLIRRPLMVSQSLVEARSAAIASSSSVPSTILQGVTGALSSLIERGTHLITQISSSSSQSQSDQNLELYMAMRIGCLERIGLTIEATDSVEQQNRFLIGDEIYENEIQQSLQSILNVPNGSFNIFQELIRNEADRLIQRFPRLLPEDVRYIIKNDLSLAIYDFEIEQFAQLPIDHITPEIMRAKLDQLIQIHIPSMGLEIATKFVLLNLCKTIINRPDLISSINVYSSPEFLEYSISMIQQSLMENRDQAEDINQMQIREHAYTLIADQVEFLRLFVLPQEIIDNSAAIQAVVQQVKRVIDQTL